MKKKIEMKTAVLTVALLLGMASQAVAQPKPTREELADNPPLFLDLARKTLKWDEPAEPAKIVGPIYNVGTKMLEQKVSAFS